MRTGPADIASAGGADVGVNDESSTCGCPEDRRDRELSNSVFKYYACLRDSKKVTDAFPP